LLEREATGGAFLHGTDRHGERGGVKQTQRRTLRVHGGAARTLIALAALSALGGWGWTAPLRAAEADAPEVLSSDLGPTQASKTDKITATFVIVGQSPVKSIKINGEAQEFTPADTVQITKTFELKTQRTVITVAVEDDKGNTRERNFVVDYGAAPVTKAWSVSGSGTVSYEVDDNPTNDAGLPFTVSGVDVKGTTPKATRLDNRETVLANVAGTYGAASVFGGAFRQQYDKPIHKGLNATLAYGGAGYRFKTGENSDFLTNLIYSDLAIGDADYATLYTVTGGFEFRTGDPKLFKRHTLELDLTSKNFKDRSQKDGTIYIAKWNYFRLNPVTLSNFNFLLQLGDATEGFKETDYSYTGGDWDWRIRWERGFRWDLGFGYQYRNYPNEKQPNLLTTQSPFGTNRVDHLLRASTGIGWQWNAQWAAMLNYRYLTDLSNKHPYVRDIYGVTVNGGF
jgi:hypothetical protein